MEDMGSESCCFGEYLGGILVFFSFCLSSVHFSVLGTFPTPTLSISFGLELTSPSTPQTMGWALAWSLANKYYLSLFRTYNNLGQ